MQTETSARNRRRRPPAALGAASKRPPQAAGERSCASCRQRRPAVQLLCWRGASRRIYACIGQACLRRLPGLEQGPALRQLAEERILQLIGLARRSGQLACGLEATADSLRRAQTAAAEMRQDDEEEDEAGEAGRGRTSPMPVILACESLPAKRLAHLPGAHIWPADKIERAAGLYEAVAVAIRPGRMATQAAYWLRLWYECAPQQATRGGAKLSRQHAPNTAAPGGPPNKTATEVG